MPGQNGQWRSPWRMTAGDGRSTGTLSALKKARADKKFAYVVALARAVNALNSAHSLMMTTANRNTPDAIRDRMNAHSYLPPLAQERSGVVFTTILQTSSPQK
jgi:hypothetical protein